MGFGNPMAVRWGRLYRGTPAELSFEEAVAELGIPYRSQFPGYLFGFRFFPDFLLPTLRVVIEVDDSSHNRRDKMEADAERTQILEREQGWKVVRVTNKEALSDPRGSLRAALGSIGMYPLPARLPSLASSLPQSKRCPQKIVREAKAQAVRAARSTPRQRRSSSN